MLSEQEAREKFCPMRASTNCIAAKCMAWRWSERLPAPNAPRGTIGAKRNEGRRGFCGLAGVPHE